MRRFVSIRLRTSYLHRKDNQPRRKAQPCQESNREFEGYGRVRRYKARVQAEQQYGNKRLDKYRSAAKDSQPEGPAFKPTRAASQAAVEQDPRKVPNHADCRRVGNPARR